MAVRALLRDMGWLTPSIVDRSVRRSLPSTSGTRLPVQERLLASAQSAYLHPGLEPEQPARAHDRDLSEAGPDRGMARSLVWFFDLREQVVEVVFEEPAHDLADGGRAKVATPVLWCRIGVLERDGAFPERERGALGGKHRKVIVEGPAAEDRVVLVVAHQPERRAVSMPLLRLGAADPAERLADTQIFGSCSHEPEALWEGVRRTVLGQLDLVQDVRLQQVETRPEPLTHSLQQCTGDADHAVATHAPLHSLSSVLEPPRHRNLRSP